MHSLNKFKGEVESQISSGLSDLSDGENVMIMSYPDMVQYRESSIKSLGLLSKKPFLG